MTLDGVDDDTLQMIAGRVPWVFAMNEVGVVVRDGHGSRLGEVAGAIWEGGDQAPGA